MSYETGRGDPAYDSIRQFLEEDPLHTALQRIDDAMAEADVTVTMEVAEDTYGWVRTLDPDEVSTYSTSTATFYVNEELGYLQEEAPNTDFSELPADNDYDAYELVYPALTLHLKFDTQHTATFPVETAHDQITMKAPTLSSYQEHSPDIN